MSGEAVTPEQRPRRSGGRPPNEKPTGGDPVAGPRRMLRGLWARRARALLFFFFTCLTTTVRSTVHSITYLAPCLKGDPERATGRRMDGYGIMGERVRWTTGPLPPSPPGSPGFLTVSRRDKRPQLVVLVCTRSGIVLLCARQIEVWIGGEGGAEGRMGKRWVGIARELSLY